MRNESTRTDLGTIKVHKNVIASISAIAALEIDGVKRVERGLKSSLLEIIGNKPQTSIAIDIDKNEEVTIDIPLIIKFGYNIPDIAGKVQESVRQALEKMTSITIKDININVQSIERG